jgi:DNA polymerase-3 subunit gamma/tau
VMSVAPDSPGLVEGSDEERAELQELARKSDETRLRRMFRAFVQEHEDLTWAPQPHAVLEMAVLRLASMPEGDDVARLLSRLEALEKKLAAGSPVAGGRGGPSSAPPPSTRSEAPAPTPARSQSAPAKEHGAGTSTAVREAGHAGAVAAADSIAEASGAGAPPEAEAPRSSLAGVSPAIVFDRLRNLAIERNRGLFASLEGGRILDQSAGRVRIAVTSAFHAERLRAKIDELNSVCTAFYGDPTEADVISGDGAQSDGSNAARANSVANRRESERLLRQQALNHPAVNTALDVLEGEIVEIRPLGERS